MKYSEVKETVGKLRELADFLEAHGHKLPHSSFTTTVNCYLTATDYGKNAESGEWESTINEKETKENLRKFLDGVGTCEKDYRDDKIVVTKYFPSFPNSIMIRGTIDRSVACKKVVTGKKFVQATLIPARMEEEVEWVCDEGISLKKLVAS